ncbi:MAG: DNA polymerase III subunit alpha, partial [Clostridiales bacterium]|nr:DNA polymerase III subunit alpha [Clostridiales bacterium]
AELAALYRENPVYKELIDMAKKLEGMPRHASTHAAGVLITEKPVTEYVPLQKNDDCVTTQFPWGLIEELGLLKMDFLGLRTLTVIRDTVDAIRESRGITIDIEGIDLTDPDVYRMICEGNTAGVFQLESSGMTQFMKELRPSGIEDLIAGGALYRPGPMDSIPRYIACKQNQNAVRYDHPLLEPILNVTYGCVVYQEQVMQIVRDLAGYSFGRADLVRRAMSKKKHDVMEKERRSFVHGVTDADGTVLIAGAVRNGVPEAVANKIFDDMTDFASYAFNKSHSAAYALVVYQTAWLKYHYPVEFMAATLNSCMGVSDKVAHYIEECRKMGIAVMPPDINKSFSRFSVSNGDLRFGLAAIKNVGYAAVDAIIAERRARGEYKSFSDFLRRSASDALNKRGIDSMIRCGALDSLKYTRASLAACYERLLDGIQSARRRRMEGQISFLDVGLAPVAGGVSGASGSGGSGGLPVAEAGETLAGADAGWGGALGGGGFGGAGGAGAGDDETRIPALPEFPQRLLLNMEKEMLGLYVSGHPLDGYTDVIERYADCDTRMLRQAAAEALGGAVALAEREGDETAGISDMAALPAEFSEAAENAAEAVLSAPVPQMQGQPSQGRPAPGAVSRRRLTDGQNAIIGGVIARIKTKLTKSNTLMAFVDLEDRYGSVEMLVFPKILERFENELRAERIVLAKGRITMREDEDAKLICEDVAEIGLAETGAEQGMEQAAAGLANAVGFAAAAGRGAGAEAAGGGVAVARADLARLDRWARGGGAMRGAYGASGAYGGGERSGGYRETPGGYADANRGPGPADGTAPPKALYIRLDGGESKPLLDAAYATMRYFSGNVPVVLYNAKNKTKKELGREFCVKLSGTLLSELGERFGAENVKVKV